MKRPRLVYEAPTPPTLLSSKKRSLPWPLREPHTYLFARARHGLWHGLRSLGLGAGDEILMPAWQHGSELEVVSTAGCTPVLFDVDRGSVEPDPVTLDRLIGPRTKALYLIHHLGWPQQAERYLAWCESRGLLLIEDCAQALYASVDGRPVGSTGALSIFCIYKTVGTGDGAVLHCPDMSPSPMGAARSGRSDLLRSNLAWLLQRWNPISFVRTKQVADSYGVENFALGDPTTPPSSTAVRVMERLLDRSLVERRRSNQESLGRSLSDLSVPAFAEPSDGACPLVHPIAVDDKRAFLQALARRGVIGLDLWTYPHPSIDATAYPGATWLRRHVVGLPVHQELPKGAVEHIVEATRRAVEETETARG